MILVWFSWLPQLFSCPLTFHLPWWDDFGPFGSVRNFYFSYWTPRKKNYRYNRGSYIDIYTICVHTCFLSIYCCMGFFMISESSDAFPRGASQYLLAISLRCGRSWSPGEERKRAQFGVSKKNIHQEKMIELISYI